MHFLKDDHDSVKYDATISLASDYQPGLPTRTASEISLERKIILEKISCFFYSQADLFQKVLHSQEPEANKFDSLVELETTKKELRSMSALYQALASDKRKKLEKLYSIKKPIDRNKWKKLNSSSQTDTCSCTHSTYSSDESKKKLEYLMGIESVDEGVVFETKPDLEEIIYEEPSDEDYTGTTEAMRQAQKYLRTHKIFQFYQFLITHLLSACPGRILKPLTLLIQI